MSLAMPFRLGTHHAPILNPMTDCLTRLPCSSRGTVVCLGAGDGSAQEMLARDARQAPLIVECDPDRLMSLKHPSPDVPPVAVVDLALAPTAGPAQWHRFNVPQLNGLLVPRGLGSYYPRLRQLGSQTITTVGVADWLAGLALDRDPQGPNVLVLDRPGLAAALLHAIPEDVLVLFEWIVVRDCRVALDADGASPAAAARERLLAVGFELEHDSPDLEPLWPVALFRFDTAQFDNRRLRAELQAQRQLAARCEAQALEIERLQADQAALQLAQAAQWAESGALLDQQRGQAAAAAAEAQVRIQALEAEHALLEQRLAQQEAETRQQAEAAQARELAWVAEQQRQSALSAAQAQGERQALEAERALLEQRLAQQEAETRQQAEAAQARELAWVAEQQRQSILSVAQAQVERQALLDESAAQRQRIAQLEGEIQRHAEASQTRQTELEADQQRWHEQVAALEAALAQQRSEFAAAADQSRARIEDLSAQLEALERVRLTQVQDLQAASAALAERDARHAAALQQHQAKSQERERLDAERLQSLNQQLLEARQASSLSIKLQTLREADLRELQDRHRAALARQQSQNELLTKLAERLTVANQYFQQLAVTRTERLDTAEPTPRRPRKRLKSGLKANPADGA